MRPRKKSANSTASYSAPLGFEAKLWAAADALRNNMGAAEYKHVGGRIGLAGLLLANGPMSANESGKVRTATRPGKLAHA